MSREPVTAVTINQDRYMEPRCLRCGHSPATHSTAFCTHVAWAADPSGRRLCDCKGWYRDDKWPPPLVVQT